jgi:hypothetical protein
MNNTKVLRTEEEGINHLILGMVAQDVTLCLDIAIPKLDECFFFIENTAISLRSRRPFILRLLQIVDDELQISNLTSEKWHVLISA